MNKKAIKEAYGSETAYRQHQEYSNRKKHEEKKKTSHRRFFLSTVAFGVGWLVFFARLGSALRPAIVGMEIPDSLDIDYMDLYIHNMNLGLQIVLGTLAYRSKKRVRLGIRPKEKIRSVVEGISLIIVVGIIVHFYVEMAMVVPAQMMLKVYIANNPAYVVTDIIALLWVIIAYLVITFKNVSPL